MGVIMGELKMMIEGQESEGGASIMACRRRSSTESGNGAMRRRRGVGGDPEGHLRLT